MQRHVELFKGAYILRELPPFYNNAGKRLRKAPKLYIRDTGLLHALLGIKEPAHLYASPQLGASWEGFGIEQAIALTDIREEQCFTWSVQGGAEVDVVAQVDNRLIGLEFKASDAPRQTRSMTAAIESLGLEKLIVIYPGEKDYPISNTIQVLSIANLGKLKGILS